MKSTITTPDGLVLEVHLVVKMLTSLWLLKLWVISHGNWLRATSWLLICKVSETYSLILRFTVSIGLDSERATLVTRECWCSSTHISATSIVPRLDWSTQDWQRISPQTLWYLRILMTASDLNPQIPFISCAISAENHSKQHTNIMFPKELNATSSGVTHALPSVMTRWRKENVSFATTSLRAQLTGSSWRSPISQKCAALVDWHTGNAWEES